MLVFEVYCFCFQVSGFFSKIILILNMCESALYFHKETYYWKIKARFIKSQSNLYDIKCYIQQIIRKIVIPKMFRQ